MTQTAIDLKSVLRQASQGDAAAWEQLYDTYGRRVYGLILKQCHDGSLAEEITQVTFVKIVEKIRDDGEYQEQGRFEAWLFRIAMNKLRDEMRRRKRQAVVADMGPASKLSLSDASSRSPATYGGDPAEHVDQSEQIDLLRQAVATLSEADQEVLHLRHTAGLSFAQIAETLEQPLGTVLARGHRALGKLKNAVQNLHMQ